LCPATPFAVNGQNSIGGQLVVSSQYEDNLFRVAFLQTQHQGLSGYTKRRHDTISLFLSKL